MAMDVSVRKELSDLVEKMTHSGLPSLEETQLKKLKRLCRSSDANVRAVHELVMGDLAKKHAEVRLSAFQIVVELFPRSHLFRQLLISDFQRLAELATGTEPRHPLPPPAPAASRLKETSLLAIRQWNERFGDGYPKLKLGFNHLKHNRKVDFERLVAQTEAVRRRGVARDARREAIAQQRLGQVHAEIADQKYDIENCLKEMESCFDILVPRFFPEEEAYPPVQQPLQSVTSPDAGREKAESRGRVLSSSSSFASLDGSDNKSEGEEPQPEEGDKDGVGEVGYMGEVGDEGMVRDEVGDEGDEGEVGDEGVSSEESDVEWEEVEPLPSSSSLKENGFFDQGTSISIQLPTKILVEETEDNTSVLAALSDVHHLLQDTYLPRVNMWLEWLTKAGDERDLKEIIDIKSGILAVLSKHKKFNIAMSQRRGSTPPPHPSPPHSPPPSTTTTSGDPSTSVETPPTTSSLRSRLQELEQDPTTIQAQLGALRRKGGAAVSLSSEGLPTGDQTTHSDAPVVPFDMDLYHWDNPEGKPPPIKRVCMSSVHQYWGSERDIELSEDQKALLKCRSIQFTGKFEPVKWSCRAPLPSGRLCPRRDRFKCPFHGPIIPRDEQGRPSQTTDASSSSTPGTSDAIATATATPFPTISEADFNEIEAVVFAAKGIDLPTGKKGKRGGRRKKHPGLTDLKARADTPRSRLEHRVFSKRAVKKVADSMDAASARRHHDKFGDTFNYALRN